MRSVPKCEVWGHISRQRLALLRGAGRRDAGRRRLLAQFPRLELANDKPEWNANTFFRGLRSLPVVLWAKTFS